jgi:hypothetical protein
MCGEFLTLGSSKIPMKQQHCTYEKKAGAFGAGVLTKKSRWRRPDSEST